MCFNLLRTAGTPRMFRFSLSCGPSPEPAEQSPEGGADVRRPGRAGQIDDNMDLARTRRLSACIGLISIP